MHRYISTDNGVQCFRCGIVLDYMSPDDPSQPYQTAPNSARDTLEDAARSLAFGLCHDPSTLGDDRAHHYVLEGIPRTDDYRLVCAYDNVTVGPDTLPADVDPTCIGG
jgi:hypothetical protein